MTDNGFILLLFGVGEFETRFPCVDEAVLRKGTVLDSRMILELGLCLFINSLTTTLLFVLHAESLRHLVL